MQSYDPNHDFGNHVCNEHALSRGSGWATNGLAGKPREMLTRNQK